LFSLVKQISLFPFLVVFCSDPKHQEAFSGVSVSGFLGIKLLGQVMGKYGLCRSQKITHSNDDYPSLLFILQNIAVIFEKNF
jgi:hypothetical protein